MTSTNPSPEKKEFFFFDYLIVLLRWHKVLIAVFLVASISSVTASLLMTKYYTSTTTIMAPKTPDLLGLMGGARSSTLQRLAAGSLLGGMTNMGGYNYIAVLTSRNVLEDVIEKFNLREHYNMERMEWERVIERLMGNVSVGVDRNEYIAISVEDKDPELAAAMANYFVQKLNERSQEIAIAEAGANRKFVEGRIEETKMKLTEAENALRDYFEETNLVIFPEQNMSALNAVADMYTLLTSKEIELAFLKNSLNPNDRSIQRLEFEINELKSRIGAIPEASIETIRRYREVMVHQRMLEYLLPVYEQARIEEQKNVPVIVVLDEAKVAEKKSKPKRMIIVLVTVLLSMVVTIVLILLRERLVTVLNEDPVQRQKAMELKSEYRKIFSRNTDA